MATANAKY